MPEARTQTLPSAEPDSHASRLPDIATRFEKWLRLHSRWLVCAGLVLSIWLSLAENTRHVPVSRAWVEYVIAKPDEDIHKLYAALSRATWSDIPRWFTGTWVYPGLGYYRPLTSVLFFFEYRAYGDDFTSYNRISWMMHGLCAGLLFLFAVSLFRTRPIARTLYGLVAAWFFGTGHNSMEDSVGEAIGWWPAQNDVLSLLFGLLSLLLLDQFLVCRKKRWLAGSLAAFVLGIGTKEMGHVVMPLAVGLIWYRWRKPAREMALFAGVGAFFWWFRGFVIAHPWSGISYLSMRVARRAALYYGGPPYIYLSAEIAWPVAAATGVIGLIAIAAWLRWSVKWVAPAVLVYVLLCAQFLEGGGFWMLALQDEGPWMVLRTLVYLGTPLVFLRYCRDEPGLFALVALALVYVPILQFVAPHYLYWPSAFLALCDACLWACVVRAATPDPDPETEGPVDRRGGVRGW